ncbi:hypothetical protein AB0K48_32525 [Nonomuraea sp. NPDC055795]
MPASAVFALPYVGECRILRPIQRLSARFQGTIVREAERVSRELVTPAGSSHPQARRARRLIAPASSSRP